MIQQNDYADSKQTQDKKKPAVSGSYSIAQARLDWITAHSPAWMTGKVQAINRFSGLTGKELQEKAIALNHDRIVLQQLIDQPPADWDGHRWLEMRTRLERWRGMFEGMMELGKSAHRRKPPTRGGDGSG